MTLVEELLVKTRLALDAERSQAVEAVASGVKDWADYQYERGRIDAMRRACAILNEEADKLGRDED